MQALADLLSTTHRGYFVFPRPDKNSLEGQVWPPSVRLLRGIAKVPCRKRHGYAPLLCS